MKTILNFKNSIVVCIMFIGVTSFAQMGIGTTTPNTNSMLDVDVSAIAGTKKGFLPPRMTTAQRNTLGSAIGATEAAMLVYDTNESAYYYWNGSAWVELGGGDTSIGNIYLTSAVSNFNIGSSATLINSATTIVNSTNFDSPSNGRLRYTGASTKIFKISATISFKRNSGSSGTVESFSFGFGKNGSTAVVGASSSVIFNDIVTIILPGLKNNDSKTVTIVGTVSLAQNDYIELFVSNANGTNIDIDSINIVLD